MKRDTETRFLTRVHKTNGCWLWTGGKDSSGYGCFKVNGRNQGAHRWAYTHWVGPVPPGLELDHLCRVRHCVNPAHLEPVTHRENSLRSDSVSAINARKTHCTNGHEFTPENTYVWQGGRYCRACNRNVKARSRVREGVR